MGAWGVTAADETAGPPSPCLPPFSPPPSTPTISLSTAFDPSLSTPTIMHHDDQIAAIRTQTFEVCDIACKANADAAAFPPGWLFHHRWANKAKGHKLPNGRWWVDLILQAPGSVVVVA